MRRSISGIWASAALAALTPFAGVRSEAAVRSAPAAPQPQAAPIARPPAAPSAAAVPAALPAAGAPTPIEKPAPGVEVPELRDEPETPFNRNEAKVRDEDVVRLAQGGYKFQPDGTLNRPGSDEKVGRSEYEHVLRELEGREKLKALLELNMIFGQYGYKNLPEDQLAEVRRIGRQTWHLLPMNIRADLKPYFSGPELEAMNMGAPIVLAPDVWMPKEPKGLPPAEPERVEETQAPVAVPPVQKALPAPWAAPQASPLIPPPSPLIPPPQAVPIAPIIPQAPSIWHFSKPETPTAPAVQPAAPASLPAATASPVSPPVLDAPLPAQPAAAEAPAEAMPGVFAKPPSAPIAAASPAPARTAPTIPAGTIHFGPTGPPMAPAAQAPVLPAAAPAAALPAPSGAPPGAEAGKSYAVALPQTTVIGAAAAAATTQVVAANPAQLVPPPPKTAVPAGPAFAEYPELSREAFLQFLVDAPYGREVKDLLTMISDHAQGDDRRRALGVVYRAIPQVVLDSRAAGAHLRAATVLPPKGQEGPGKTVIALSPGPVLLSRRKMFFKGKEFMIPDSLNFYRDRSVAFTTALAAAPGSLPVKETEGEWGRVRTYEDGSQRLRYSREQVAGTLLHELLVLDARLHGYDNDPYHAELRALAAQYRFYRRLKLDTNLMPTLDQDLSADFMQWLTRPQDHMDFVLQSLASPADGSPRRDVRLLEEAGAVEASDARQALRTLPEPAGGAATSDSAFQESSPLGSFWAAEEARFRAEFNPHEPQ